MRLGSFKSNYLLLLTLMLKCFYRKKVTREFTGNQNASWWSFCQFLLTKYEIHIFYFLILLLGEVGIRLIGCFKDTWSGRALPILYENVRDKIDWTNMNETVRQCADAAANHDPRKTSLVPLCSIPMLVKHTAISRTWTHGTITQGV